MFRVKGYRHVIYIYYKLFSLSSPPPSVVSKRSYEFHNFFKVISPWRWKKQTKFNTGGLSSLPPPLPPSFFPRANLTKHRWNLISVPVIEFAPPVALFSRMVFSPSFSSFFFFLSFFLFFFFFAQHQLRCLFII